MNIYKIVCRKTGQIYVGSTQKTIEERLKKHESARKCYERGITNNITSFKVLEANDYYIELLEVCEDAERYIRERFYIQTMNCVNRITVGRTHKEYRDTHTEQMRQYRHDHKDIIREHRKQYYQTHDIIDTRIGVNITCECGSVVSKKHIARHHQTKKHIEWTEIKSLV